MTDGTLTYVYGLGLACTVDGLGNVQVLHTDGLGSVRALTDGSGNVTQTFNTDEFGNPTLTQGSGTSEPFRYTGQQRDAETGFYDLRARYYWPSIGRFVTRDTVVGSANYPLTLNRYTYAGNTPVNAVDPTGLDWLGVIAHQAIEDNFTHYNPGWEAEVIHRSNNAPPGNPLLGSIRVDLGDSTPQHNFYEIKPASREAQGIAQVTRYIDFARRNGITLTPAAGYYWPRLLPTRLPLYWVLAFQSATMELTRFRGHLKIGEMSPQRSSRGQKQTSVSRRIPCRSRSAGSVGAAISRPDRA